MKKNNFSLMHKKYIQKIKKEKFWIVFTQIFLLIFLLAFWEIATRLELIDSFFFSSPSRILNKLITFAKSGELNTHIFATLYETILGFIISTLLGFLIAVLLWWSERVRKILDPYIVILNSLPKIALGPIIIIWVGIGLKSIITMCVLICIVITILTMLNSFTSCEKDKILLMRSMGAKKYQIFLKLIFPNSIPNFISLLKINVGMSWVGTIMGEYLNSSEGLGYLIVYGGQVFNLDLVMTATFILCVLAGVMYAIVALIEKRFKK